jgi:hypothetical protein
MVVRGTIRNKEHRRDALGRTEGDKNSGEPKELMAT